MEEIAAVKTLRWLAFVLSGLWLTHAADGGGAPSLPRPNMVIFLSDDHGYLDSEVYGAKDVRTPNMVRLAKAGMAFTHCFVASPSCAPSRAAMLTGLMPARNGAEANHSKPRAEIRKLPAYLQESGYEVAGFGKVAHYNHDLDYGFDHYDKRHAPEVVREFLEKRDRTRPLCLFVGAHAPHVPWSTNATYKPAAVLVPAPHVDTPATRNFRARYYTDVSKADSELGAIYDLARAQLGTNLLFIYTSDHGAQWPFGKWNLYDAGIRVPFIASWPGVITPGSRSEAMVSWIDILPTLADFAGAASPRDIDGRSFAGVLRGRTHQHRDRIFSTHSADGRMNIYPMRSLRTRDWKYIANPHPEYQYTTHIDAAQDRDGVKYWRSWQAAALTNAAAAQIVKRYESRPREELYDLQADPLEQRNLVADAAHADRLKEFRGELEQWMTAHGDKQTVFGKPRLLGRDGAPPPSASITVRSAARRPNIVLILADDMGFSDIGSYGGEIATPNIDRLATNGLRFTQFYNAARCCPTRASLLTGLHPHQAGIHHVLDNQKLPLEKRQLSRSAVTIAEVLGQNGYRTAMSGKWHVCPVPAHATNGPMERGFEKFYGIIHGGSSYYAPVTLRRDRTPIEAEGTNYFLTDAIAENAASYVREFSGGSQPFFIYAAFTAPHWPLHAPAEDAAKYTNLYARGWDVLRQERHERQIKMGIVDRKAQLTPRDARVPAWTEVKNKDWQATRMAVYAAQVERMDRGIGRIVEALQQSGALDHTLILFLSDNGACAEILGAKQNALHVPKASPTGGPMRLGSDPSIVPGPADTYASYGVGWANLGSTPFRLYKHWVHEGGIATPLVVHWPAAIKRPGLPNEPAQLTDIMATCLDVAGAKYPNHFNGNTIQPLEGVSLARVFRGKHLDTRPLFWEHEGNRAVRKGNWKLVSKYPQAWELYDLANDRSETRDLAAAEPKVLARMTRLYDAWAKRVDASDWASIQDKPATPAPTTQKTGP